jgi:hypothetical protein
MTPTAAWRTPSIANQDLADIMDCEPCGDRAENDPDDWWGGKINRQSLITSASRQIQSTLDENGKVRFLNTQSKQPISNGYFLSLFVPEQFDENGHLKDESISSSSSLRVPTAQKVKMFFPDNTSSTEEMIACRREWSTAVAAASVFRRAIIQGSEQATSMNGCVYWKGPGFSLNDMDKDFLGLVVPTCTLLSSKGDPSRIMKNRDKEKTPKVEFTIVRSLRVTSKKIRVPGAHGFTMFDTGSSTLIVPGRTRKHRCEAPVHGQYIDRNIDGMAHLSVAMKARNARVADSSPSSLCKEVTIDQLVRDSKSQLLITDEELAFGLRLVALDILRRLRNLDSKEQKERIWWCTHGHDIPWLHFKVFDTKTLLSKKSKPTIKHQYTCEHLKMLGFDVLGEEMKVVGGERNFNEKNSSKGRWLMLVAVGLMWGVRIAHSKKGV